MGKRDFGRAFFFDRHDFAGRSTKLTENGNATHASLS